MKDIKTNIIGAVAILAFLGVVFLFSHATSTKVNQVTTQPSYGTYAVGGTVLQTGTVLTNPTPFSYLVGTQAVETDGIFAFNGVATSTGLMEMASVGTCSTASSTIFSIVNPFHATSTAYHIEIWGTEGATSTDILIATSSTPYVTVPLTSTSTLGANLINLAGVSASLQFFSVAGDTIGGNKGYARPDGINNSISKNSVVVGPSESILGFSTSTALAGAGGTGVGQVAVPASCTYKILWRF